MAAERDYVLWQRRRGLARLGRHTNIRVWRPVVVGLRQTAGITCKRVRRRGSWSWANAAIELAEIVGQPVTW